MAQLAGAAFGAANALRQQQQDTVSLQDILMQRALQERQMLMQQARDAEQRRQFEEGLGQRRTEFGLERQDAADKSEREKYISIADNLPPGIDYDEGTVSGMKKVGLESLMNRLPGAVTQGPQIDEQEGVPIYQTSSGPERYQSRGGSKFILAQEAAETRKQIAADNLAQRKIEQDRIDADRDAALATKIELAKLAASGRGNNVIRPMQIQMPDGSNRTVLVNANGEVVFDAPSQLPASMKKEDAEQAALLSQIDDISAQGERTKWAGTGILESPISGFLKRSAGIGSNEGDLNRIALETLKADIAHDKYGAAFTSTERQMLAQFAPGSNMDSATIKNRLAVMRRVISQRLGEIAKGGARTPLILTGETQTTKAPGAGSAARPDPLGLGF